jgi:hypothetical protein
LGADPFEPLAGQTVTGNAVVVSQHRIRGFAQKGVAKRILGLARQTSVLLSTYDFASGPARGERGLGIIAGGSNLLSNIIVWWIEHEPKALPGLMDSAMRTTVDNDVVMKCYDALNLGSPNNLKVLASA